MQIATGLAERATWSSYVPGINFLSHYVYNAPKNPVNDWLVKKMKRRNQLPDIFTPDGFVAAQMIVRAVQKGGGEDVDKPTVLMELDGPSASTPSAVDRPEDLRDAPADVPGPAAHGEGQAGPGPGQDVLAGQRPATQSGPSQLTTRPPSNRVAPILATRNLGLDIGGATIVADVGLEVRSGEFLDHRAKRGRQDLALQPLSGLYRPTHGTIEIAGRTSLRRALSATRWTGIGRSRSSSASSAADRKPERSSRCRGAARRRDAGLAVASRVRETVDRAGWARSRRARRAEDYARRVALPRRQVKSSWPWCSRPTPRSCSSTSRWRRAALRIPKEVIRSVQAEEGKTVLMVEGHHIHVVTGVAERIAVMHHGSARRRHDRQDHGERRGGRLPGRAAVNAEPGPLLSVRDPNVYLGPRTSCRISFDVPRGA